VLRAGPHNCVLALGLPQHMVAQLLVEVDVSLCAEVPLLGLWELVVEETLKNRTRPLVSIQCMVSNCV